MPSPIRCVLFDLGRVLIDFDHLIAARAIAARSTRSPQELFDFFFNSPLVMRFEEGALTPEAFFAQIKRQTGIDIGFREFVRIWNGIFFMNDHNKRVYQLAKSLRGRYRVGLLSNVNKLHFEYLRAAFPVFDIFDRIFTSYALGMTKPDPRIYRAALEAMGSAPQETFYVDDRAELIAAASALGLRAFVYTGVEQLKRDLLSCGVAPEG